MTRRELSDEQIEARMPKKPGRAAMPAAQPVAVVLSGEDTAPEVAAVDGLAQLQASYGQERDLVNQLLGQAKMAGAFEEFSRTVRTSKLAFVKERKLYRSIAGAVSPHGAEKLAGTWEEFCRLLGRSVDQVDRDIANVQAFGEQALESMSAMGIGYRELRQYRRLPEDQKLALIEVAKAGDKEGFVELAEEIIAKHAKEKEAAAAQAEEARATLEAKDRVLQSNAQKINEQAQALELARSEKFTPRPGSVARTKAEDVLLKEVFVQSLRINTRMRALFHSVDAALGDSGGNAPEAVQQAARASVQHLAQQFADLAQEFGIVIDLDERIEAPWTAEDEAALQVLAAKNAAEDKAAHRPTH